MDSVVLGFFSNGGETMKQNPKAHLLQHLLKPRERSHRTNAPPVIGGRRGPKIRTHLLFTPL
jgi:hypothetical protein